MAAPGKIAPDALLRALNFALLGSGSQAFLWESPEDCVVVSDTYDANGGCRFTEVLHLSKVDGSPRIDVRQFVEDCVEQATPPARSLTRFPQGSANQEPDDSGDSASPRLLSRGFE
jgi:hypothetical protein